MDTFLRKKGHSSEFKADIGGREGLKREKRVTEFTLCREKVRTQKVASSIVSSRVTWIVPYVSVPRLGQYWSHFIYTVERKAHYFLLFKQPLYTAGKLGHIHYITVLQCLDQQIMKIVDMGQWVRA